MISPLGRQATRALNRIQSLGNKAGYLYVKGVAVVRGISPPGCAGQSYHLQ